MSMRAAAVSSLSRVRSGLAPLMDALRALNREETPEEMLAATARELASVLDAGACVISRLEDGLLYTAARHGLPPDSPAGDYAYLLSDFPVTQSVIESGEAKAVSLSDPDVDSSEAFVLSEVRMHALLMLPLLVDRRPWGLVEVYDSRPREFGRAEVDLAELLTGQAAALLARFEHEELLQRLYRETLASLSNALEAKDGYTSSHTENVVALAVAVGERLGLGGEALGVVELGALLHDIGKVRVPESILNRPGPLTEEEWEVIRAHPVVGERILAPITSLRDVLPIVRSHHERWDGQGYPDGLAGEAIPLGARVVSVCDAFRAMIEERPYRRALTREEALLELGAGAGTQFDPACVDALLSVTAGAAERGRGIRLHRPNRDGSGRAANGPRGS